MSWFSKKVLPVFKRIKLKHVAAVAGGIVGGPAIGAAILAGAEGLKHAAEVGREQVQEIARREGVSEVEAAAILAKRLGDAATTQQLIDRHRNTLLWVAGGAIGFVLLLVILRRKG